MFRSVNDQRKVNMVKGGLYRSQSPFDPFGVFKSLRWERGSVGASGRSEYLHH